MLHISKDKYIRNKLLTRARRNRSMKNSQALNQKRDNDPLIIIVRAIVQMIHIKPLTINGGSGRKN